MWEGEGEWLVVHVGRGVASSACGKGRGGGVASSACGKGRGGEGEWLVVHVGRGGEGRGSG